MLTWMVFSPSIMGRWTASSKLDGIPEGSIFGSWHQSRSFSMHWAVDAGISTSPGEGNMAVMRSIMDNCDSMISGDRIVGWFCAILI